MSKTQYTINWATTIPYYVLLAVIAGALAALTYLVGYSEYTPFIVVSAIMAGVLAALMQYSSTGNIPGTPIPLTSLVVPVITAVIAMLTYLLHYNTWTYATIIAGVVIFLTVLMQKITQQSPTPAKA